MVVLHKNGFIEFQAQDVDIGKTTVPKKTKVEYLSRSTQVELGALFAVAVLKGYALKETKEDKKTFEPGIHSKICL